MISILSNFQFHKLASFKNFNWETSVLLVSLVNCRWQCKPPSTQWLCRVITFVRGVGAHSVFEKWHTRICIVPTVQWLFGRCSTPSSTQCLSTGSSNPSISAPDILFFLLTYLLSSGRSWASSTLTLIYTFTNTSLQPNMLVWLRTKRKNYHG